MCLDDNITIRKCKRAAAGARARAPATGCQIPLPFRCRPRFTATEPAASDSTKFRLIPLTDDEFWRSGGVFREPKQVFSLPSGKSEGGAGLVRVTNDPLSDAPLREEKGCRKFQLNA